MSETYTHGHHESVLRSHKWRTGENSAAYLLPHLQPGMDLLDIGCGPGTITVDLAARVLPGSTIGLDASADIVDDASKMGAEVDSAVTWMVGDVYALDFPDASFDVVHAHQVLQHLTDPVGALREMRRVLRPGGLLAVRDGDFGAFTWWPEEPMVTRWRELYYEVVARNRAEADGGRHLPGWVREAGFTDFTVTSANWTYADPDSVRWWGDLWADRVEHSGLGQQALAYGLATPTELEQIAAGWRRWAEQPDALFVAVNVEVIARR
jgi:SAM-dependent methyltransferase